jgi:hypothetical protein
VLYDLDTTHFCAVKEANMELHRKVAEIRANPLAEDGEEKIIAKNWLEH